MIFVTKIMNNQLLILKKKSISLFSKYDLATSVGCVIRLKGIRLRFYENVTSFCNSQAKHFADQESSRWNALYDSIKHAIGHKWKFFKTRKIFLTG